MYFDGKQFYLIGAVLDISRNGRCPGASLFIVVYVTIQAIFGRPMRSQQMSSPLVRLLLPDFCSAL